MKSIGKFSLTNGRTASFGSGFQRCSVFYSRHRGEHLGIARELGLQGGEFLAEGLALSGFFECAILRKMMPAGGEGADDLVQHYDGQFGELGTDSAISFDDVARQFEELVNAVESGLLHAVFGC